MGERQALSVGEDVVQTVSLELVPAGTERIRNEGYIGYSVFLVCLELEFCSWLTHGQENDLAVDMEWDESPDIDKRLETRYQNIKKNVKGITRSDLWCSR